MTSHCTVCRSSVSHFGRARGFRLSEHQCPCGGALAKGRGDDDKPGLMVVRRPAVPTSAGDRGLKRSHRRPQAREA
jgi:hypothetical protein